MGILLLKLILTSIPCAALCVYVFINDDKTKKLTMPFLLFALGALITVPVSMAETALTRFLFTTPPGKLSVLDLFGNRLIFAFVEELAKWVVLLIYISKKRTPHCVSCAFFITAGFALAENLLYFQHHGVTSTITRSTSAAIAHCFCGIISGYFFEVYGIYKSGLSLEKQLFCDGVISECKLGKEAARNLSLSLLVPTFLHGIYNFACFFSSATATSLCIVYCISLYLLSFYAVLYCRKSLRDVAKTALKEVCKKHPADAPEIIFREQTRVL